jgi:hypothetical protein
MLQNRDIRNHHHSPAAIKFCAILGLVWHGPQWNAVVVDIELFVEPSILGAMVADQAPESG